MDLKPRTLGREMISKTVASYEEIVWRECGGGDDEKGGEGGRVMEGSVTEKREDGRSERG